MHDGYTYILIPDETGGYTGEILEFPGCYAEGDTPDATMAALRWAAEAWIDAASAHGQDIPVPLRTHEFQGKVALRLPRSLHRTAVLMAAHDNVSLNTFLVTAIALHLGARAQHAQALQEG
jgi:predicted RNase H-like HicB family nuclease